MTSPSAEERKWLRQNWTPEDASFRSWVAGSGRAHSLVLPVLDALEAAETARETAYGHVADHMIARRRATVERDEARAEVVQVKAMLFRAGDVIAFKVASHMVCKDDSPDRCDGCILLQDIRAALEPAK